jgi:hypothetical protein
VSSFRDPHAASALAMCIDEHEAQEGLTRLGLLAIPGVLRMLLAADPDQRLAAVDVLARIAGTSNPNERQQRDVRRSLSVALSDKERAVREAANRTMTLYGGKSVAMAKPLFPDRKEFQRTRSQAIVTYRQFFPRGGGLISR